MEGRVPWTGGPMQKLQTLRENKRIQPMGSYKEKGEGIRSLPRPSRRHAYQAGRWLLTCLPWRLRSLWLSSKVLFAGVQTLMNLAADR